MVSSKDMLEVEPVTNGHLLTNEKRHKQRHESPETKHQRNVVGVEEGRALPTMSHKPGAREAPKLKQGIPQVAPSIECRRDPELVVPAERTVSG